MILIREIDPKQLTPTNDWIFKRIYGRKSSKKITEKFIKAFLDLDVKIEKIHEQKNLETDVINEKAGILDILVETVDGEQIDLEMQVGNYQFATLRLAKYACQLFSNGIEKGEPYSKTRKTIAVMFLKEDTGNLQIYPEHTLKWQLREEKYHNLILTEKLEVVIISLEKLTILVQNGSIDEKEKVALWTKFLLNPRALTVEEMKDNPEIKEAHTVFNNVMQNMGEVNQAIRHEMFLSDMASIKEEGLKEGIDETKKEIAKKMLDEKLDIELIMKMTGLAKEEIEKLK